MKQKRCPWCGKKIDVFLDIKRVQKKHTPMYLTYAQCGFCNNYYGQSVNSMLIKRSLLIACLLLLIALVSKLYHILFFLILLPFIAMMSPLQKMDKCEKLVISEHTFKVAVIVLETNKQISINEFYFLNNNFDDLDSFVTVSPIYVYRFDNKNNRMLGYFLYDHQDNAEYIDREICNIYDSNGDLIAKVKLVKL